MGLRSMHPPVDHLHRQPQPSSNPRVVKEADALTEASYSAVWLARHPSRLTESMGARARFADDLEWLVSAPLTREMVCAIEDAVGGLDREL
jgi:hypothetical protein